MRQKEYKKLNEQAIEWKHQPEGIISKPNDMINLIYDGGLTLHQKLLYNFVIRGIFSSKNHKTDYRNIEYSIKEYQDFMGINDLNYKEFKKDLKAIQRTIVTIPNKDTNYEDNLPLLSKTITPKADKREQKFYVSFHEDLISFLLELDFDKYSNLPYKDLNSLNNTHSLIIYELFKRRLSGQPKGSKVMTDKDIKYYLNIPKKQYPKPTEFNRSVIKKVVKDINENTTLKIIHIRSKISKGIYTNLFKISQAETITFNHFARTTARQLYLHHQGIKIDNIKYEIDIIYKRDIQTFLFYRVDISQDKALGIKRNIHTNRETLSSEEALKINHILHNFYKENGLEAFITKFFKYQNSDEEMTTMKNTYYERATNQKEGERREKITI